MRIVASRRSPNEIKTGQMRRNAHALSRYVTESAAGRLNELHQTKLLVVTPGEPPKYRFNAASPDSARVSELEKIYKERRVSVISFIYSKPSDPLRAFSDAFRLRKDEP